MNFFPKYGWVREYQKKIAQWLKGRSPWMLRKTHQQQMGEQWMRLSSQHDQEVREKEKIIDELLPKLFKITQSLPDFGTFRVTVDWTDQCIYQLFVHGNSQEHIRYIATRLASRIERDIMTANWARFRR